MKSYTTVILSATLLLASGCDFLTEKSTTTPSKVYDSEYALETNMRGIIRSLEGSGLYAGTMMENLQSCSCLVHWGTTTMGFTNRQDYKCTLEGLNLSGPVSINLSMYSSIYAAINRCNVLIDALPDSPVNQEYKKQIEAEAKFYRAFFYFTAVRIWGDVPLKLKGVVMASDNEPAPRTSYNEVYCQIVHDLKDAWEGMRDPVEVEKITPGEGRPDKWAAKALLSVVYLQMASILTVPQDENFYDPSKPGRTPDFSAVGMNNFGEAWQMTYDTAMDVINNGPYRLAKNFGDLYKWTAGYKDAYGRDCWHLDERILMLQSNGTNSANYSATRTLMNFPPGSQVKAGTSVTRQAGVRPTRFLFQKWCEKTDGEKGGQGSNLEDVYIGTDDPRLELSLWYKSFDQWKDGQKDVTVEIYPTFQYMESASTLRSMPIYRKYWTPTYTGIPDVADMYLLRYAEIFYVAAEARARLGSIPEAIQIIDNVHLRARKSIAIGGESPQPRFYSDQFGGNVDKFVTALVWDKLFEFCGENHEFFETRRLGARWFRDEIVVPVNEFMQHKFQKDAYRSVFYGEGWNGYNTELDFLRGSLLCEFPKDELSMNTAMTFADKNDFSHE